MFFLVITPAGLLVRLVGHRPLVPRRNADDALGEPTGRVEAG